jgi:XTP/dITP diphosphohydrolase
VTTYTLTFVTATANPDKVREIASILGRVMPELVLLPRPERVGEVIEDADTLVGNARLKAVALMRATGLPSIADDTGLFVDALGGAPGVQAAVFAGPDATYADNCAKLLNGLSAARALRPEQRAARFTSVAFVAWPNGSELWCEGHSHGVITLEPSGDDGFGYDPLFAPVDAEAGGQTFRELDPAVKNAISHRARAFRSLAAALQARKAAVGTVR